MGTTHTGRIRAIPHLAWTAFVLALACWYIRLETTGERGYFFNSDMVAIELFCRDLKAGIDLSNWQFSGAPSFFPDFGLYLVLSSMLPSIAWRVLAYSLASVLLMTAGWVALWRLSPAGRAGTRPSIMYAAIALGMCGAMWRVLDKSSVFTLAAVSHSGILVLLPWILWSTFRLAGISGPVTGARRMAHCIFLWVLLAAGFASDKLMLPQVIAPVMAVVLLLLAQRQVSLGRTAGLMALVVTGTIVGIALFRLVASRALPPFFIEHEGPLWRDVLHCFSAWISMTWTTIPFHASMVLLFTIASMVIVVRAIRSWQDPDRIVPQALAVFFLAGAASSLGAMAVTGMTNAASVTRYMMPTFFIPVVWGWPILVQAFAPAQAWVTGRRGELVAAAVALLAILLSAPALRDAKVLAHYGDYYPRDIRHVDKSLARRGLRHGIAGYWSAKQFRGLSRYGIDVVPVLRTMEPYCFVDNWSLYTNQPQFVLIDRSFNHRDHRLDEHAIIARYGLPASAFQHGNLLVMVYDGPSNTTFQSMFKDLPVRRF